MRTFLGVLFLASLLRIHADIIANGDFSQGSNGWGGDASETGLGTTPFNDTHASGITVHLRSDLATRLFQSVETHDSDLTLTLTCTPSADCKFTGTGTVAKIATDLEPEVQTISTQNPVTHVWQTRANLNYKDYISTFNNADLIIVDRDANEVHPYSLRIDPSSPREQTVRLNFGLQTNKDYKLYLAFPPGEGSITLHRASVAKSEARVFHMPSFPQPNPADNLLTDQGWTGPADEGDDDMGSLSSAAPKPAWPLAVKLKGGGGSYLHQTFRAPTSLVMVWVDATPSTQRGFSGDRMIKVSDILRAYHGEVSHQSTSTLDQPSPAPTVEDPLNKSVSDSAIFGDVSLILIDQQTNKISSFPCILENPGTESHPFFMRMPVTPHDDYMLFLVFPPGRGNVVLNKVILAKSPDEGFATPRSPSGPLH